MTTRDYTPAESKTIRTAWDRFCALAERFGDASQAARVDDALRRDKAQRRPPVATSQAALVSVAAEYMRGPDRIDPDLCDSALTVAAVAIRIGRAKGAVDQLPAFLSLAEDAREAEQASYQRLVGRIDAQHPPVTT